MNMTGGINNGDKVLLSISVQGSNIVMSMKDWNTGAEAEMSFSNEGATGFEGTLRSPNYVGFFSGLMTEWHHNAPYYYQNGTPAYYQQYRATYSPYGQMPTNGWLFLFKICTTTGCLNSNGNMGYVVADRQASGDVITYTPENTTNLKQQDLPYSFNSYDGQADTLYQNGTFQTGLLQPKTTTTIQLTTTTSSTSTSTSTSTLSTTSTVMPMTTTTATTTTEQRNSTKAENAAGTSPINGKNAGTNINAAIIIGAIAILAAVVILIRKKPKPPSMPNAAQAPTGDSVQGGSGA
jgi:hypothetical protein